MNAPFVLAVFVLMPALVQGCGKKGPSQEQVNVDVESMENALKNAKSRGERAVGQLNDLIAAGKDTEKIGYLSNVIAGLGDFGGDHGAQMDALASKWDEIKAMSDEKFQIIATQNGIIGTLTKEMEERNKREFAKLKDSLDAFSEDIKQHQEQLRRDVEKFATKQMALATKAKDMAQLLQLQTNPAVKRLSQKQALQLQTLEKVSRDKMAELQSFGKLIQNNVSLTAAKANDLLTKSTDLKKLLSDSFENLSDRLTNVTFEQAKVELVMRYSRILNRLAFLTKWYADILEDGNDVDVEERHRWAKAVVLGEPTDYPIEDLIEDLKVLITGQSDEFEVVRSKGSTLLEIHTGNIREIVEHQQGVVLESKEESKAFEESNRNFAQSRRDDEMLQSEEQRFRDFGEKMAYIETNAFSMAFIARTILDDFGPRETTARFRRSPKMTKRYGAGLRFCSVTGIAEMANMTKGALDAHFKAFLPGMSNKVRLNLPVMLKESASTPSDLSKFALEYKRGSHNVIVDNTIAANSPYQILTGCRFGLGADILGSQADSGIVVTQCVFAKPPNNGTKFEVAPIAAEEGVTKKAKTVKVALSHIIVETMRVKDPDTEFICQITMRRFSTFSNKPLGVEIGVCSKNETLGYKFLRRVSPDVKAKIAAVQANQPLLINKLWVREMGGWTTGIGLSLTPYAANEKFQVLSIELESGM